MALLGEVGVAAKLRDERQKGQPVGAGFLGELTLEQDEAASALLKHDIGVLAAATGFGKTVIAAKIIAARDRSTLVLVHRRQLLDQWLARLRTFLDIAPDKIGVIRGRKKADQYHRYCPDAEPGAEGRRCRRGRRLRPRSGR